MTQLRGTATGPQRVLAGLPSKKIEEPGCARLFAGSVAPGVRPPAGPSADSPATNRSDAATDAFGRRLLRGDVRSWPAASYSGPGPKLGGAFRLTGGQGRLRNATPAKWNCLDEAGVQGP